MASDNPLERFIPADVTSFRFIVGRDRNLVPAALLGMVKCPVSPPDQRRFVRLIDPGRAAETGCHPHPIPKRQRLDAGPQILCDQPWRPSPVCGRTVARNHHGRHEHRAVETFDRTGQLDRGWDELIVRAARVPRLTRVKHPETGRWRERSETSFYVCRIAVGAADFAEAVRDHWTIENCSHHVRDVALG